MPPQTVHRDSEDFMLDVAAGIVPGHRLINKFGSSLGIDDSAFKIIAHGEVYQVPTTAQPLEFESDNIGDALNGLGMWEITVIGLDANLEEKTEVVAAHVTSGLLAVAIPGTWMRVYRAYVSASGVYASLTTPSHLGEIKIQSIGGADTWAIIGNEDIAHGQTQIGAFTVPSGETAFLNGISIHSESLKPVNVFGFLREGANTVAAPFNTMRMFTEIIGLEGSAVRNKKSWYGPFPEFTDLGFLAKGPTPSSVSVSIDFEILLIKNHAA